MAWLYYLTAIIALYLLIMALIMSFLFGLFESPLRSLWDFICCKRRNPVQ